MHCLNGKVKYSVEKLDECVTFSRNSSPVHMYFCFPDSDQSRNQKVKSDIYKLIKKNGILGYYSGMDILFAKQKNLNFRAQNLILEHLQ